MEQRSLEAAKAELRRAIEKVGDMELVQHDPTKLSDSWSEFLIFANRVFSKLEHGAKTGTSKGWFDKVKNIRKTDKLLRYIYQARHVDEHGIQRITRRTSRLQIDGVDGGGVHLRNFKAEGATGNVSFEPLAPMEITSGIEIRLVPVRNRGVTYDPPEPGPHLGTELAEATPLGIAKIAAHYLRALITEAELQVVVPAARTSRR